LITGASGLLGKSLVDVFVKKGFFIFAQYYKNPSTENKNCSWLFADFSKLEGIRSFLEKNQPLLQECTHLINAYGPITVKNTEDLKSEDFASDYYNNVITAYEMSTFLIRHSQLQSVVNIGFEFVGMEKAYKKVLAYALAKNSLFLLTKSMASTHPHIRFNLVSPGTIKGAKVILKKTLAVPANLVARTIMEVSTSSFSGRNILVNKVLNDKTADKENI
jgi:NAD(P)-dependent dehydrogenase (short-subunit alcohol dehydrogenase family)